jgi:hypothetical protein
MFRSLLFDHLQGAVFHVWCCYHFSACLFRQVVYLVCGCMLSMCVRAQAHRQHTATYQINNLTKQTSREVVTALSTKDGPLKMVKQ